MRDNNKQALRVFVGSNNPVKIKAVETAVLEWRQITVTGYEVPSGVSVQPRTDAETRRGARNRARRIWKVGYTQEKQHFQAKRSQTPQLLGVGLEGGVFFRGQEVWSTVWAAVTDDGQKVFESNGARFRLPERIAQPILAGAEMGPVLSDLFGGIDIKRQNGGVGVLTNNFVTRAEEYAGIVKLALGLWYGQDWECHLPLTAE